jgi:hypothetical protein
VHQLTELLLANVSRSVKDHRTLVKTIDWYAAD